MILEAKTVAFSLHYPRADWELLNASLFPEDKKKCFWETGYTIRLSITCVTCHNIAEIITI